MNAYIDLGAFRGAYIKRFKTSRFYTHDTKIWAVECNPMLKNINYGPGVRAIHEAAWICDGTVEFCLSKTSPGVCQGSSVYKEKRTGNLDSAHPVKVKCFDFSKFLTENFTISDNVLVKMNIEGAEYDVLEHLLKEGTIILIKELFVQWHYSKCRISAERHNKLCLMLKKIPGLIVNPGYGKLNAKHK
jgi:FkbM family methyltransferase